MTEKKLEVLVVGAGPVGLFCANELIRHGIHCRIIDKKSTISDKSKALAIHIRSLDVLEDCGFIDEILTQGQKINGLLFRFKNQQLADVDFSLLDTNRHFLIALPQNQTESILYQGLTNKGLVVEWETELTEITQDANGVTALLKHQDGHSETVQVPWIIACDGSHSTLREQVKAEFSGDSYKQTWWLADLRLDWNLPNNKIIMFISQEGPMACFPMGGNRYRLVMTAEEKISHTDPTLTDIERVFKRRCKDQVSFSDAVWITQFGIAHKQIDNYRYGRVFFAGDAAHVHSPAGGQGLNTGMQDIYNLVWKLALVQKGFAREKLLDSYHSERHPIGEQILKKTGMLTRMIMLRNPLLIFLRNKLIKLVTSFNWFKKYLTTDMAELTISYAQSPIVKQLGNKTAFKEGEFPLDFFLTDLHTKERQSFYEIIRGTMHHLFLFTGKDNIHLAAALKTASVMNQRYASLIKTHLVLADEAEIHSSNSVFFDPGQVVHQRFAINETTALLIRPDKYIGLTQCPIEQDALVRYIDEFYLIK
ncbi:FAD-dependent monooxygenase [Legionella cardiaca]|uniref:FAD-dependent monooxygenase n=1 Tax=Legionella cardiaca TaxID=1071983 RepID=A0ABY8ARP0_9GAMM|nr:FAD-dependent monooxygenase [Legionella cardiaca]WED43337.1 FAD-dependent monooxygenase [Legionella cardiaca]